MESLRIMGKEFKVGAAAELYSVGIGSQPCSCLKAPRSSDFLSLLRMQTGSQCLSDALRSRGGKVKFGGISAVSVECQPVIVVSVLQLASLTSPEGRRTFQQAPDITAATLWV